MLCQLCDNPFDPHTFSETLCALCYQTQRKPIPQILTKEEREHYLKAVQDLRKSHAFTQTKLDKVKEINQDIQQIRSQTQIEINRFANDPNLEHLIPYFLAEADSQVNELNKQKAKWSLSSTKSATYEDQLLKAKLLPFPDAVASVLPIPSSESRRAIPCPFHSEKTPSFHIYKDHGYCFGCGWSGDSISFLQKYLDISFKEALIHIQGLT